MKIDDLTKQIRLKLAIIKRLRKENKRLTTEYQQDLNVKLKHLKKDE